MNLEKPKKEVEVADEVLRAFEYWAVENAKTNPDADFVKGQLERMRLAQETGDHKKESMARGMIVSTFDYWKNNIYKKED